MLRLIRSLRPPYDCLHEEDVILMDDEDDSPPGGDAPGDSSEGRLKLPHAVDSSSSCTGSTEQLSQHPSSKHEPPASGSPAAPSAASPLHSWRTALGIKARSNTKHLDRSVRSQQLSGGIVSGFSSPQDSDRYIRLPERATVDGSRSCDSSFEETHLHVTVTPRGRPEDSCSGRLHLTCPASLAAGSPPPRPEKSRSENALLQRLAAGSPRGSAPLVSSPLSSTGRGRGSLSAAGGSTLQRLLRRDLRPSSPRSSASSSAAAKLRSSSLERNHKFRVVVRPTVARPRSPSPPRPRPRQLQLPGRHEQLAPQLPDELVNLVMTSQMAGGGGSCRMLGNFINKPARGWLHQDSQLADEGICYAVRYVGCLEVRESMKALNFEMRSLIAKECISRVCETAGLKSCSERRTGGGSAPGGSSSNCSGGRLDRRQLARSLGERPIMDQAGCNVTLTITSDQLTLYKLEDSQIIAQHDMPNISFASGGDPDTMDFVAYVAKDSRYGRVCFVLECGGVAQNVITTIGQAFELRYRDYLKRTTASGKRSAAGGDSISVRSSSRTDTPSEDPEYYNDLPGKMPPDLPPVSAPDPPAAPPPLPASRLPPLPSLSSLPCQPPSAVDNNLIDLNTPPASSKGRQHEYVNGAVLLEAQTAGAAAAAAVDPFDMQPFDSCLPADAVRTATVASATSCTAPAAAAVAAAGTTSAEHKQRLQGEPWFHGVTSRKAAETLLCRDGDFLVRESHGAPGQFVLSGQQSGVKKHLLLVDPEGVVRTKDRTFNSVSHLVQYHRDYQLPIISSETALTLRNPVIKR